MNLSVNFWRKVRAHDRAGDLRSRHTGLSCFRSRAQALDGPVRRIRGDSGHRESLCRNCADLFRPTCYRRRRGNRSPGGAASVARPTCWPLGAANGADRNRGIWRTERCRKPASAAGRTRPGFVRTAGTADQVSRATSTRATPVLSNGVSSPTDRRSRVAAGRLGPVAAYPWRRRRGRNRTC